jgi:hypothetical protein
MAMEKAARGSREAQDVQDFCLSLAPLLLSLKNECTGLDEAPDRVYVHQLPMDADFLDFIRFGLHRTRISWREASELEERMKRFIG